ncbi:fimbrial protein [Shewanella frigidimarina]|uniref:fimbrial protein n=1 Tax=Shewanella frigidimarina TaxID=56812 RepID=UPI003182ABB5
MTLSSAIMFYVAPSFASVIDLFVGETHVSGVVVSSICSVEVEHNASNSGVINFGEHNKATQSGINSEQLFWVKLYENQSTSPGCSAFALGSNRVSLKFGDRIVGQLDGLGVVTHGAGDGVRIAISSTDSEKVSSTNVITANHSELFYSQIFASKGVFGFRANAVHLELATPGTYSGALSLTVSYQ